MLDSFYRKPYQKLLIDPLLHLSLLQSISPSTFTLCAFLSGLAIPFFLYYHMHFLAVCALAISGFFDTLDGSIARRFNKTSNQGAMLDIVSDRFVETFIILGLFLFNMETRGLLCLGMLSASYLCVTTFLVVGIFTSTESEKSFFYSPGIVERGEAFLFFVFMILFPSIFQMLAISYISLVLLTTFIRVYQFQKKHEKIKT